MKHRMTTIICLLLTVVLMVCINSCSKMPKGKMESYSFTFGGGMNPLDLTVYYLRHDEKEDGKMLLTISGQCPGELITVEAGPEVMEHCRKLFKKHKLYRSTGFYESKIIALDAPTPHFSVTFNDPLVFVSGSGDWPDFISNGVSDINKYLVQVVGDQKAEGHVDRLHDVDSIAGMSWTDGYKKVVTPDNSEIPLKLALRQLSDSAATNSNISQMGYSHFRDGERQYFVIHDYQYDLCRIFYSYDGRESKLRQMKWRDEVAMLSGSFTDSQGRNFVFTTDGRVAIDGSDPQQFFYESGGTSNPAIIIDGHKARSFKITETGVDFYDIQRPGDSNNSNLLLCLTRVADKKEMWPVVNQRFLSMPMIDSLSDVQLEQMLNSIRMHSVSPHSDGIMWYTDIGEVNFNLLSAERDRRKK